MRMSMLLAGIVVVAGCRAWPRADCPDTGVNPETVLDKIEAAARAANETDVLAAIRECRCHDHGDVRDSRYGDSCVWVIKASVQALKHCPDWKSCAAYLRHVEPRKLKTTSTNAEWRASPTDYGTVEEVLTAIDNMSPRLDVDTSAGRCLETHVRDTNPPGNFEEHIAWVEAAYLSALGGAWDQCKNELDHMIGTG